MDVFLKIQSGWVRRKRTRGGDQMRVRADSPCGMLYHAKGAAEVCFPDIPPVNHTQRQLQIRRNDSQNVIELFWRADQVEVDCSHWKIHGGREIRSESFEIKSDKEPERGGHRRDLFICKGKCPTWFPARLER